MKLRSVFIALILITLASKSPSTTILYRSLNDLALGANSIVVGEVLHVNTYYTSNKELIRTTVTINVTGVLKGLAPQTLTFTHDGGTVGETTLHVGEMPFFKVGERVILFLTNDLNEMCPVFGMSQGRFNIVRDPSSGVDIITNNNGDRVTGLSATGDVITDRQTETNFGRVQILSSSVSTRLVSADNIPVAKMINIANDFVQAISALTNIPTQVITIPEPKSQSNNNRLKKGGELFSQGTNPKPSYAILNYWKAATCTIMFSPGQFPDGSTQYTRMKDAAFAWNNLSGSRWTYVENTSRVEKPAPSQDGTNFITRGPLSSGVLGVTYWWTAGDGTMSEMDLIMSTSVTWTYTNPSSCTTGPPYDFFNVAVHEFGHGWGLGHESNIACTLNPYYPGGWSGNWGHDVMSDDRNAVRLNYSSNQPLPTEFFTTRWKLSSPGSGSVTNVSDNPATAAVGSPVTVEYSIHTQNLSKTCKPLRVGFYLSTDNTITPSDNFMGCVYISPVDSFTTNTYTSQVTIPQVSSGSYYIGWYIDDLSMYAESNEANNGTSRCAPITITSGTARIRNLTSSASTLNFGSQQMYVQSSEKTITLTNSASSTEAISGYAYLDCGVTEFAFSQGQGAFTINPGQTYTIGLTFTPGVCGTRSTVLHIDHEGNNTPSPMNIAVTGTGACADIIFTNTDLQFGKVDSGTIAQKDFVFENASTSIQTITGSVSITNNASNQFTIVSGGGSFSLTPGASRTVVIQYKAKVCGDAVGELTITHTALNEPSPKKFAMNAFGACRTLVVSPSLLNFGNVETGSLSMFKPVTLTNSASSNDTITVVVNCPLTGSDPGNFIVNPPNCGTHILAPGQSYDVNIRFKPTRDGVLSAQLQLDHNATSQLSPNPFMVDVTGIGYTTLKIPIIQVLPFVDFGSIAVGNKTTKTLTVSNIGVVPLSIRNIQLEGAEASDFTVTPTDSFQIQPGQQTKFNLSFTAGGIGLRATSLKFSTNDPSKPQVTVSLTGFGLGAHLTLDAQQLDFGQVTLGSNASNTFSITNDGNAILNVTSITLNGTDSSDFTFSPMPPYTIAPNQSQSVMITFNPSALGQKNAKITLTSNGGNPVNVDLLGEAIAQPIAKISFSTTTIDFGSIQINTNSTRQLEISNQGTASLTITSIAITPFAPVDFSTNAATPVTLQPGQKTTITITFAPKSVGSQTAILTIQSSDAQNPTNSINLKGNSTALPKPEIVIQSLQVDFGTVVLPAGRKKYIIIENNGSADLIISSIQLLGIEKNEFKSTPNLPLIIHAGLRDSIEVTFFPISTGSKSAQIQISHNDQDKNAQIVDLVGNALNAGNLVVSSQTLDFGTLDIKDLPRIQTLVVQNNGGVAFNITKQQLNGTNVSEFQTVRSLPASLAPGVSDSTIFSLTPNASKLGSKSATLRIETDSPTSPNADVNLTGVVVNLSDVNEIQPKHFALYQNYPNPFGTTTLLRNLSTDIRYDVSKRTYVEISIYNAIGNLITKPIAGVHDQGSYIFHFDATPLTNGIYFYKMTTDGFSAVRKMTLMK